MKKITTLVLIFSMITNLHAQLTRSLILVSGNQDNFTVFINQNQINPQALNVVEITDLHENFYDVSIHSNLSNHVIKANLYVPPLSKIVYRFYAPTSQNPLGKFMITELLPIAENNHGGQSGTFPIHEEQVTIIENPIQTTGINININNTVTTNTQEAIPVMLETPVVTKIVYVDGYMGEVGCQPPLTKARLQNMLTSIKNQSFASSKKRIAKQIISNNCMVVSHLVDILELFNFESDKLEMAKFAYDYTYDIENYYEVNKVFDFESSIEELDYYLQNR